MARQALQARLDRLETKVLEMADLVRARLGRALRALYDRDASLARSVADTDDAVDDRYLALEAECVSLLALEQPVAGDLRTVVASFKIVTDLERIADLATNLAGYAIASSGEGFPEIDLCGIGDLATRMVETATGAYAIGDDEWACREVAALDDDLDARCEHASEVVVRYLLDYELDRERDPGDGDDDSDNSDGSGSDNSDSDGDGNDNRAENDENDGKRNRGAAADAAIERLLRDVSLLLYTIRDIERVGDHAVNIAARTLYMVESDSTLV
jgi:phosphate transport system protein